jgi:thioesterase domain-containing protein/acyl carrier protein
MAETFPLSTDDRVLAKTPVVFDVAVWEWFWPLSQGACLVLASPGAEKDSRSLLDAIEAHQITNIHFVPTLLRVLLDRPDLHRCRSLQRVFCSGEALPADLRDLFFERIPGPPALVDVYGPTEAAVHVTGWVCTPGETGPVPIGHPLPNVRAYIVDPDLNAVPEGVRGELLVGGVQVARGYLRRPELTRERFVPDPFVEDPDARCYRTGDCVAWRADGAIDYFGRYDSQIKLGGVRVELGEVEAALRLHPAVGDAAAAVREDGGSRRLVAYLRRARAGGTEPDPTVESLRRVLADSLPTSMMPGWYVWLDQFPVTATGKLDRRALPSPDASRLSTEQAFEPPTAGAEAQLATLWRDELKIDRIGRHDDFHLLGVDSLGALRLFERIRDTFGVDLPLATLFEARTVAELAVVLRDRLAEITPPESGHRTSLETGVAVMPRRALRSLVVVQPGVGRPLFVVHGAGGHVLNIRDLARAMRPTQAVSGLQASGIDGVSPPGTTIEQMAQTYLDEVREVQPHGPYMLAGYSGGGIIAFEMARRLEAAGEAIGVLAFIDTFHPQMPLPQINALTRLERLRREGMSYIRDAFERRRRSRRDAQDERRLEKHLAAGEPIPLVLRELYLIRNFKQAARGYTPPAWPGKALLFRAEKVDYYHRAGGPAYGWDKTVVGGIEIIPIPGDHDTLLLGANAQRIAHRLAQAIDEAEAGGSGQGWIDKAERQSV